MKDILNTQKAEVINASDISTANRLEIIEEYLRKSYLGRLNEMQVAPMGNLQKLEDMNQHLQSVFLVLVKQH